MSGPLLSAVLILPAAQKETGDLGAVAMGHANVGAATYGLPLSPSGQEPATHYGCHSWVSQPWLDTVATAKQGTLPAGVPWASVGKTEVAIRAMATALIVRTKPDGEHEGHFDAVCAELGLKPIVQAVEAQKAAAGGR